MLISTVSPTVFSSYFQPGMVSVQREECRWEKLVIIQKSEFRISCDPVDCSITSGIIADRTGRDAAFHNPPSFNFFLDNLGLKWFEE